MTREFKKLSHTLYQCKYHIVFCPKYRYRVLQGEVASYVKQEMYRLCTQKEGVEVLEANVQADHVHVVLSIWCIATDGISERKACASRIEPLSKVAEAVLGQSSLVTWLLREHSRT
jgi:hypothetical protein